MFLGYSLQFRDELFTYRIFDEHIRNSGRAVYLALAFFFLYLATPPFYQEISDIEEYADYNKSNRTHSDS